MWPAWLLFWHISCAAPGIKSDSRSSHAVLYCRTYSFFPPRSREIFLWPSYSLSARSIMSGHNGSKATSFNAGREPRKASWVHTLCGSVKKKKQTEKKKRPSHYRGHLAIMQSDHAHTLSGSVQWRGRSKYRWGKKYGSQTGEGQAAKQLIMYQDGAE